MSSPLTSSTLDPVTQGSAGEPQASVFGHHPQVSRSGRKLFRGNKGKFSGRKVKYFLGGLALSLMIIGGGIAYNLVQQEGVGEIRQQALTPQDVVEETMVVRLVSDKEVYQVGDEIRLFLVLEGLTLPEFLQTIIKLDTTYLGQLELKPTSYTEPYIISELDKENQEVKITFSHDLETEPDLFMPLTLFTFVGVATEPGEVTASIDQERTQIMVANQEVVLEVVGLTVVVN